MAKVFPDNISPFRGEVWRCGSYVHHWKRGDDPDKEVDLIYVRRKEIPGMALEEYFELELLCLEHAAKLLTEAGDIWEVAPESLEDEAVSDSIEDKTAHESPESSEENHSHKPHKHYEPVAEVWRWVDAPSKWKKGINHGGREEWIVYVRRQACSPWVFDYDDKSYFVYGFGWSKAKKLRHGHVVSFGPEMIP